MPIQSLVEDWLDENGRRAYPLQPSNHPELNPLILDAQIHTPTPLESLPNNAVGFAGTSIMGPNMYFLLNGGPNFELPSFATATYPAYIRHPNGSLLVVGEEAKTFGNSSFNNVYFEPSTYIRIGGAWAGVSSLSFEHRDNRIGVTTHTSYGIVEFREGYQFKVDIQGRSVILGANRNYGEPISCEQFFDWIDDCADVISFINGVTTATNPGVFRLSAGSHIIILEDASQHTLYVGLNFGPNDICQPVP